MRCHITIIITKFICILSLLWTKRQQTSITCDACVVFRFCVCMLATEYNETVCIIELFVWQEQYWLHQNCVLNVNSTHQLSMIFLAWQLHQVIQMHQDFWDWCHFHHVWNSIVFEPPDTYQPTKLLNFFYLNLLTHVSSWSCWILSLWNLKTHTVQEVACHQKCFCVWLNYVMKNISFIVMSFTFCNTIDIISLSFARKFYFCNTQFFSGPINCGRWSWWFLCSPFWTELLAVFSTRRLQIA